MHQGGSKRLHGAPVSRKPPVRASLQSDPQPAIACDQCGESLCDWRPLVRGRGGMSRRIVTIGPPPRRFRIPAPDDQGTHSLPTKMMITGKGSTLADWRSKRLQLADAAGRFSIDRLAPGSAQLPQIVAFPLDGGPNRVADSDGLLSLAPLS